MKGQNNTRKKERKRPRLKCKTDFFVFSIQQGMRIVMRTDRRDAKGEEQEEIQPIRGRERLRMTNQRPQIAPLY